VSGAVYVRSKTSGGGADRRRAIFPLQNTKKVIFIDAAQLLNHLDGIYTASSRRCSCRVHILSLPIIEQVERAAHARDSLPRDVRVDHGSLQALVPQELLHRANIHPALDQMRRETVAKRVAVDRLVQAGAAPGLADGPLEGCGIDVMPARTARAGTVRQLPRGKHELPAQCIVQAKDWGS
jgi:hypothetical protein